jgi:hypothetical protein
MFMSNVIRTQGTAMTNELIERSRQRHEFADGALIVTTATLVVSLVIAITAVSIGIARADTLGSMSGGGGGGFAWIAFFGLAIAGLGGLAAAMAHGGSTQSRRNRVQ